MRGPGFRFIAGLLLASLLGLLPETVRAEEKITDYIVGLSIAADGTLTVQEDISIIAEGNRIRHGIYRDLPALVPGGFGLLRAPLQIDPVLRDGQSEPSRIEQRPTGVRIYLGDKDSLLSSGRHTYRLRYHMGWQIRHFDTYDELYWNVTGNGWDFAIERASAHLTLPEGAHILQQAGYAGPRGSKGQEGVDFTTGRDETGREYRIAMLHPLARHEGLTFAVAFPRGLVPVPDRNEWFRLLNLTNPAIPAGLVGLMLLGGYFILAWVAVGRDPAAGPVVPNYKPASSPAVLRYVRRMGFDQKTMVAALLSLATKGYLTIEERGAGGNEDDGLMGSLMRLLPKSFVLTRTGGGENASTEEETLYQSIFSTRDELVLSRANRSALLGILRALQRELEQRHNGICFHRNLVWFFGGLILSILIWLALAVLQGQSGENREPLMMGLFMSVWLGIWSMGSGALLIQAVRSWRKALSGSPWQVPRALFETLFAVPFAVGWGFGLVLLGSALGYVSAAFLVLVALLNVSFLFLLRAPTAQGRTLMDEADGTALYLTVAEADRLRFFTPPDTPETFEKFLPYAVALDVETEWTHRFAGQLQAASATQPATGRPLTPRWYSGSRSYGPELAGGLAGALTSAVTAATASRRSGSGGGGSSGGGSGGGGGGGW